MIRLTVRDKGETRVIEVQGKDIKEYEYGIIVNEPNGETSVFRASDIVRAEKILDW